jgi:hypothetical protein
MLAIKVAAAPKARQVDEMLLRETMALADLASAEFLQLLTPLVFLRLLR